eukprot:m.70508 g.70508  ORF g.70508 m.70508 type:complete len:57 (-) comp11669_c0_seq3:72-242(-)
MCFFLNPSKGVHAFSTNKQKRGGSVYTHTHEKKDLIICARLFHHYKYNKTTKLRAM